MRVKSLVGLLVGYAASVVFLLAFAYGVYIAAAATLLDSVGGARAAMSVMVSGGLAFFAYVAAKAAFHLTSHSGGMTHSFNVGESQLSSWFRN